MWIGDMAHHKQLSYIGLYIFRQWPICFNKGLWNSWQEYRSVDIQPPVTECSLSKKPSLYNNNPRMVLSSGIWFNYPRNSEYFNCIWCEKGVESLTDFNCRVSYYQRFNRSTVNEIVWPICLEMRQLHRLILSILIEAFSSSDVMFTFENY